MTLKEIKQNEFKKRRIPWNRGKKGRKFKKYQDST